MGRKPQNNAKPKSRHLKCAKKEEKIRRQNIADQSLCLVAENTQNNILE